MAKKNSRALEEKCLRMGHLGEQDFLCFVNSQTSIYRCSYCGDIYRVFINEEKMQQEKSKKTEVRLRYA